MTDNRLPPGLVATSGSLIFTEDTIPEALGESHALAPGRWGILHIFRAQAIVMDMKGRELHRWRYRYQEAFPGVEVPAGAPGTEYWRRVALLDDGELLGLYEGRGLIKLDRKSRLLWTYSGPVHHDRTDRLLEHPRKQMACRQIPLE